MKAVFVVKTAPSGSFDIGRDLAVLPGGDSFTEVAVEFTRYSGHAIDIAREHCASADLVVAVGGDGTLNEVVNGCMAAMAEDATLKLPVFGIIASGTANDFIKSTSLRGSLEEVVALAASKSYRPVDLGRVDYRDLSGHEVCRYFINVADVGIGASVARRVNASGRRFGANAAYLLAIVMAFIDYRKPSVRVRSDAGLDWQGRVLACIIGNGRCFGSGLYAVPDAVIDDNRLHSAIIGDVSVLDFVRKLPRLKSGRPIKHPEVIYHSSRSVTISAQDGLCAMEVDGEYLDCRDVTVSVVPAALSLLLP
jgi:YegS/Rv2252/BmrU family lipid kinase